MLNIKQITLGALLLTSTHMVEAQTIRVNSTLQNLIVTSDASTLTNIDANCFTNLSGALLDSQVDAGSTWMTCPNFTVLVNPKNSVVMDSSNGSVVVTGEHQVVEINGANLAISLNGTFVDAVINNANGPVSATGTFYTLQVTNKNAPIEVLSVTSELTYLAPVNSQTTIKDSLAGRTSFAAVNSPISISNSALAIFGRITNSDIVARRTKFIEGSKSNITGKNSDLKMSPLSCSSASALSPSDSYTTTRSAKIVKKINKTTGKLSIVKKVRKGKRFVKKGCASFTFNLTNGKAKF